MTGESLGIVDAIERMRGDDDDAADDVIDALRWMLGDAPISRLNQASLQQFLWFELPYKWLGGAERHQQVQRALRRFFDLAGLGRYADICGDPFTSEQVDRFAGDDVRDGFLAFQRHHGRTGVVPPDTGTLAWGDLMGEREFDAFWQVAMALELAVEGGILRPGERAWRTIQARLAAEVLARPRPDRFGESLLDEVRVERLGRWIDGDTGRWPGSAARTQLLAPVGKLLLHPPAVPRGATTALAPLLWLRERAGGPSGCALTRSGELTRATVVAAADGLGPRLGWTGGPGHSPGHSSGPSGPGTGVALRSEAQVTGLRALRELAIRVGFVRVRGGRLVASPILTPTPTASAAWSTVVERWLPTRGLDAAAWPLFLAGALSPDPRRSDLERRVNVALSEMGWSSGRGAPLPADAVRASHERLGDALAVVQGVRRPGSRSGPLPKLTRTGESLARAALWRTATAPTMRGGDSGR